MMSHSTESPAKKDTTLHLTLGERIEIIRSNRHFLAIFPFFMLVAVIVIFGIWTGGRFFRPNVLKGVLSQGVIVATCATGVAFIYANGNLDISIGAVLGLAATFGAMAYNSTGSTVIMIAVCLLAAMAIMLFNYGWCPERRILLYRLLRIRPAGRGGIPLHQGGPEPPLFGRQ